MLDLFAFVGTATTWRPVEACRCASEGPEFTPKHLKMPALVNATAALSADLVAAKNCRNRLRL
jgi:hypothetical protein